MKNIPVYMGSRCTASLVLREIPYSKRAYILLRTVFFGTPEEAAGECGDFCRECGAETLFVSREKGDLSLPHAYDILRMTAKKAALPEAPPVALEALSPGNEERYLKIYNECFASVSSAAFYDHSQLRRIRSQNQQGFVALLPDGTPFGMGELHGNELAAIGVLPPYRGMGDRLALSLLSRCPGPEVCLTVASDNLRALALYRRLGFSVEQTVSRWYQL